MPAPMFPANAHRYDPYRTFKFQVVIAGRTVAGLSKMGALKRTTEAVKWRAAGDVSYQRVIPGGTAHEAVAFEQVSISAKVLFVVNCSNGPEPVVLLDRR